MVQANALLLAAALTVTVPSVAQARWFPCWVVKAYVNGHSKEEIEAMAKKATAKERAAAIACLKDKK